MHRGRRSCRPRAFRAPARRAILSPVILHDERRHLDLPLSGTTARLGRDPDVDVSFDPADDVVSAVHARVWRETDGSWWLEDLGSTNGTWLNGRRLTGAARLATGDRFTLGRRGPALKVTIPGELASTRVEPAADAGEPALRLRRVAGGEDLAAIGREIVIGRSATATIALRTVADTVVSKRHALVAFDEAGDATIRDLESKNGTYVNGQAVRGPAMLRLGDRLMLGWHGPLFEVRTLGTASLGEAEGAAYHPELQPAKTLAGMVQVASDEAGGGARRGVGRAGTFVRSMARQLRHESSRAFRVAVAVLFVALAAAVVLVYRSATRSSAEAAARLAAAERAIASQLESSSREQLKADSEIRRLRRELAAARGALASRAVVDSLETLISRARAAGAAVPQGADGPGAAGGADFSRVAAENQGAVALVIARYAADSTMGSGFVITRSGYLLTNGHVVEDSDKGRAVSVAVVMADSRAPLPADVVAVSDEPNQDVAVLKIRRYAGPAVRGIDWMGRGVRQGESAALIGFPRGLELAVDAAGFVRTTMFGGIIAKATSDWIEFAGFTDAGSSGSPLFDAAGDVIGMHYGAYGPGSGGGARTATPLGFAIPIGRARRWLPPEARAELGL